MKTLFTATLLLALSMHKAEAFSFQSFTKEPVTMKTSMYNINNEQITEPCMVNVIVPKTGTAMDCYGNYHFINAAGSCTASNSNCDIAFFEALQCARNKANDEYNKQLFKIRQIQCAVTSISAE
jgi:hypothetical protein